MARLHHPDLQKTPEGKAEGEKKFLLIAKAYEILRDPDQKQEYDYMIDNPQEMYYHYYRYLKRRYTPKVDLRLVIASTILILSTIQYVSQKTRYEEAISHLVRDPKHRNQAKVVAIEQNRFRISKSEAGRRRLNRDELKEREERIIREIIRETVDLRRKYGSKEQEYLTRHLLGFSQARWDGLLDDQRAQFIQLRIWEADKYEEYMQKKTEEFRIRAADDSNQKRYRRYMKRAGPQGVNLEDL